MRASMKELAQYYYMCCEIRSGSQAMLPPRRHKRERVQLAQAANAKLGQAIAKAQSSLVAECKSILDSTIGGNSAGPSGLTNG